MIRTLLFAALAVTALHSHAQKDDTNAQGPASECLNNARYTGSARHLAEGMKLLDAKDYLEAITSFDQGLEELGFAYYFPELLDDSGQAIVFSKIEQTRGNLSVAANLKRGALSTRVKFYELRNCPPSGNGK